MEIIIALVVVVVGGVLWFNRKPAPVAQPAPAPAPVVEAEVESAPAVAPTKAEAQMLVLKKYENTTKFQPKELVQMLKAVGFQGDALKYAWAIAMKESHGNALDYNGNTHTGDNSYGLFQVNMLGQMGADRRAQFGLAYNAQLLNPVVSWDHDGEFHEVRPSFRRTFFKSEKTFLMTGAYDLSLS